MNVLASARTRILTTMVVLLAFSSLLSLLAIRQLLVARTTDRVDATLEQEVEEFRRVVRGRDPATGEPFGGDLAGIFATYFRRNAPVEGETTVAFLDGRLFRVRAAAGTDAALVRAQAARWRDLRGPLRGQLESGDETVGYLAVPVRGRRVRGVFAVARSRGTDLEIVDEAIRLSGFVLLSVLVVASGLAWAVAGRVLAPLRSLSETARAISDADLSRRIEVLGDDELAQLGRTFNEMLDRLERAFASQQAFLSDASHELRTPITIVRGHLELLGDDPRERRETVALVTDELDRMSRFVDDLLLLARSERADFLRVRDVELGALTDELMDKAVGLGPRAWTLESRAEGLLSADRERLTQAVMGLAQNAVQHTSDDDPIWIGSEVRDGEALIWVRDAGPGIAEADQGRVFDRFARASDGRRRSDGAGLGLSIVRAIAQAHQGRVALESRPGEGSRFTIALPLSRARESVDYASPAPA